MHQKVDDVAILTRRPFAQLRNDTFIVLLIQNSLCLCYWGIISVHHRLLPAIRQPSKKVLRGSNKFVFGIVLPVHSINLQAFSSYYLGVAVVSNVCFFLPSQITGSPHITSLHDNLILSTS